MSKDGLTAMTKLELVIRGSDARAARELMTASGASGYTAVSNVSGLGHHGYHEGRLLFNDEAALDLLIAVVPEERAEALIAGIRDFLSDKPGVMFVSDTYVSRPEYFA
jgi:nitrogen regulatory protein PII